MLNQNEAHSDRNDLGHNTPHRDTAGDRPATDRPLADREVPLPGMAASEDPSVIAIHQWLDGELTEADARRADAKQVAMWNRIAVETDQRRRMATPAHVAANIMAALPAKEATKHVVVEAAKATSTATFTEAAPAAGMSMTTVFIVGTAMLALGVVVGKVLL
jgi:hypothetical protein